MAGNVDSLLSRDSNSLRAYKARPRTCAFNLESVPGVMTHQALRPPGFALTCRCRGLKTLLLLVIAWLSRRMSALAHSGHLKWPQPERNQRCRVAGSRLLHTEGHCTGNDMPAKRQDLPTQQVHTAFNPFASEIRESPEDASTIPTAVWLPSGASRVSLDRLESILELSRILIGTDVHLYLID